MCSSDLGSIICRELLGMEGSDKSPVPQVRTAEYYQKRPCAQMAGLAAGIMEEYMAQMRQDAI